jgi:hypothetical protein
MSAGDDLTRAKECVHRVLFVPSASGTFERSSL